MDFPKDFFESENANKIRKQEKLLLEKQGGYANYFPKKILQNYHWKQIFSFS